jgi:hypothetical protein
MAGRAKGGRSLAAAMRRAVKPKGKTTGRSGGGGAGSAGGATRVGAVTHHGHQGGHGGKS